MQKCMQNRLISKLVLIAIITVLFIFCSSCSEQQSVKDNIVKRSSSSSTTSVENSLLPPKEEKPTESIEVLPENTEKSSEQASSSAAEKRIQAKDKPLPTSFSDYTELGSDCFQNKFDMNEISSSVPELTFLLAFTNTKEMTLPVESIDRDQLGQTYIRGSLEFHSKTEQIFEGELIFVAENELIPFKLDKMEGYQLSSPVVLDAEGGRLDFFFPVDLDLSKLDPEVEHFIRPCFISRAHQSIPGFPSKSGDRVSNILLKGNKKAGEYYLNKVQLFPAFQNEDIITTRDKLSKGIPVDESLEAIRYKSGLDVAGKAVPKGYEFDLDNQEQISSVIGKAGETIEFEIHVQKDGVFDDEEYKREDTYVSVFIYFNHEWIRFDQALSYSAKLKENEFLRVPVTLTLPDTKGIYPIYIVTNRSYDKTEINRNGHFNMMIGFDEIVVQ